jgi:hypothetical protein
MPIRWEEPFGMDWEHIEVLHVASWREAVLMPWAPRGDADPVLTSSAWRRDRDYWKAQRLPCARKGCRIDYDGPRWFYVDGQRRQNPAYLVVGHKVSRYRARQLGWTEAQINARSNQQPECQDCSNKSGARLGRQVQDEPSGLTTRRGVKPTKGLTLGEKFRLENYGDPHAQVTRW